MPLFVSGGWTTVLCRQGASGGWPLVDMVPWGDGSWLIWCLGSCWGDVVDMDGALGGWQLVDVDGAGGLCIRVKRVRVIALGYNYL